MKVPPPIKAVFDAFPLVTYPPIASTTDDKKQEEESRKYYFQANNNHQDEANFSLGIFNIVNVNGTIIPSDPLSCSTALILADINKLKLPKTTNESSNYSLVQLSLYSSPDEQLPILIEDQNETRSIKTSTSVDNLIEKRFTIEEKLINQLFTNLYDCWLLCLLTEDLPSDTWKLIFNWGNTVTDKLQIHDLIQQMPNWHAFNIRNPQLFENNYNLLDYIQGTNTEALNKYYHLKLAQLSRQLPLLICYQDSKFIKLKLVAYVITIAETLPSTELGTLIQSDKDYLNKCYETIASL